MIRRPLNVPSIEEIKKRALQYFKLNPCLWQGDAATVQIKGKHALVIVPTGGGKSLAIWLPLLFETDTIIIMITPLNALANQHAKWLNEHNIPALSFNSESNTKDNIKVSLSQISVSDDYILINLRRRYSPRNTE